MIDLGTGNLRPAKPTRHPYLDALGTKAHGVLNDAAHRPAELHTTLQLLSNILRDQERVEFRFADFFDVDVYGHIHHLRKVRAQAVDVLALLADHDAWTGGINGYSRGLRRPLDIDAANRCLGKPLVQIIANLKIVE